MKLEIGKTALITTSAWFIAPDGLQYKSVFGTIHGIFDDKDTLGISTNRHSTNWYVEIGNMTISGCQINYAIRTDKCNFGKADDYTVDATNGIREYQAPSRIYNAN